MSWIKIGETRRVTERRRWKREGKAL